jgi:ABC-type branched-subunit amino acid transport system substrate-binding protein
MFAAGAEKANSLETEKLIAGMKGIAFDAPQGNITVDPATQHTSHAFHVAEITGNTWHDFNIVLSKESIQPASDCGKF